jgi:hypothetical protein
MSQKYVHVRGITPTPVTSVVRMAFPAAISELSSVVRYPRQLDQCDSLNPLIKGPRHPRSTMSRSDTIVVIPLEIQVSIVYFNLQMSMGYIRGLRKKGSQLAPFLASRNRSVELGLPVASDVTHVVNNNKESRDGYD